MSTTEKSKKGTKKTKRKENHNGARKDDPFD